MSGPPGVLFVADVAAMWGVKPRTVHAALDASKPAGPGRKAGRYADNPVPPPDGYTGEGSRRGNRPWWWEERAAELRAWHDNLPGRKPPQAR